MTFVVRVSDEAIQDIDESYIWYDFQQTGLGDTFAEIIDKSFRTIARNPDSFIVVFKGLRKYTLPKFPFNIYYRVNTKSEAVEVIRILHHKRDKRRLLLKTLRRK
jgi:plasmid stabilization system protein ParE